MELGGNDYVREYENVGGRVPFHLVARKTLLQPCQVKFTPPAAIALDQLKGLVALESR